MKQTFNARWIDVKSVEVFNGFLNARLHRLKNLQWVFFYPAVTFITPHHVKVCIQEAYWIKCHFLLVYPRSLLDKMSLPISLS